ncbi:MULTISPECIES: hypothetical protein [unclassified Chryseobacterium]|uniref:hypothetical protein n=1 Tax=unclassified Chryseobacterium TaxID=2593645 RepID=UPI0022698FD7|nr:MULTISPECIES: hypothetical protein [unclassified Chryseobacterium]
MKKLSLLIVLSLTIYSCESGGGESDRDGGSDSNYNNSSGYCTYNGHKLYVGEKGGCYYLSSGGNKEYVDKKYCVGCN